MVFCLLSVSSSYLMWHKGVLLELKEYWSVLLFPKRNLKLLCMWDVSAELFNLPSNSQMKDFFQLGNGMLSQIDPAFVTLISYSKRLSNTLKVQILWHLLNTNYLCCAFTTHNCWTFESGFQMQKIWVRIKKLRNFISFLSLVRTLWKIYWIVRKVVELV